MLEKPFLYSKTIILRPISTEDAETIFISLFSFMASAESTIALKS